MEHGIALAMSARQILSGRCLTTSLTFDSYFSGCGFLDYAFHSCGFERLNSYELERNRAHINRYASVFVCSVLYVSVLYVG